MTAKGNTQADLPLGDVALYAPVSEEWEAAIAGNNRLIAYCVTAAIIATIRSMATPTTPGEVDAMAVASRFGMTAEHLAWVVDQSSGMRLKTRLRWVDPKARTRLAISMPDDVVQRVFARWLNATGRSHATLDTKRRARIEARLAEGISPAMMMRAVDGIAGSDWHRGNNDRRQRYDTIEVVFRDSAQVERFAEMSTGGPRSGMLDRVAAEAAERRGNDE